MKHSAERVFAFLLALLMGISILGGIVPSASAEEIEVTDSYVLSYDGSIDGYSYGHLPYMYKSPFKMSHSYNDPEAGPNSVWTYTYTNEIFQLINTSKIPTEGAEGVYASIPAYCTDADTSTRSTATYRRINLEDSTYHVSGAAARLRTVILNSFPYIQDSDIIMAAANEWLAANNGTQIRELKIGEIMLATQQAIWEITHGEKYTVNDHYTGIGTYDGSDAVYQLNADETASDYTENNIIGLYQYFLAMEGTAPADDAVSEATFENVTYSTKKAEDGTYSVTVSFDVNTTVGEGDTLTLSASCGSETKSIALEAGGNYSFRFDALPDRQEVKLEINGYQVGGDVYLFDALGDRTNSQSLIGYDNSRLPVHGEVVMSPDRIIDIYKTTNDEGEMPLANISFDIYQVATMEQLESGEIVLGETPTAEDIASYQTGKTPIATIKTDVQGYATYNFTENGYPDGVYLIVEQFSPATTGPVEPFFIIVPGTTEDEAGYTYTITVNPKNTTETGPDIKKDVTEIENNEDSYDANDPHTWIIRGGVPAGIGTATQYVITDTLDCRLSYVKGSPAVKLYTKAGEELPLTLDAHYTLKEETKEINGENVDHFEISLTADGMSYVASSLGEGNKIPEIRVYFQAMIDSDAAMGEEIPNQAHLDYTNSAGVDYDADSDVPKVYMGGTNILKTDVEGAALEGAVFKIAREATAEELLDDSIVKEKLTYADKKYTVVFEDFYPSKDLSGEKVYEVTTDTKGKAAICGLAYGTYFIVETKAPDGYNLLTSPIRVTINKYSHLTSAENVLDDAGEVIDNTIRVINTKFALPETGGVGTTMFTVTGLAIISAALTLLAFNNKKKQA